MIRLLAVSIVFLLLGPAAEAGVLLESIECDAMVVALHGMELSAPDQDQSQIRRVSGHEMTGVETLSHDCETSRSIGILVAPHCRPRVQVEIAGTAKQCHPCEPCRSDLLRPPQHLNRASV